jgi:hypothetical protein
MSSIEGSVDQIIAICWSIVFAGALVGALVASAIIRRLTRGSTT